MATILLEHVPVMASISAPVAPVVCTSARMFTDSRSWSRLNATCTQLFNVCAWADATTYEHGSMRLDISRLWRA